MPDFSEAFLRGVILGVVGLISQPPVAIMLGVMLVVGIGLARRRRR
jgi:MYXO-CTERM domain-containing protein